MMKVLVTGADGMLGRDVMRALREKHVNARGVDVVRSLLTRCRALGIPYVTVYALSRENLKRPPQEVRFLFDLFIRFLKSELPELSARAYASA